MMVQFCVCVVCISVCVSSEQKEDNYKVGALDYKHGLGGEQRHYQGTWSPRAMPVEAIPT